jgi:hypothetical protein
MINMILGAGFAIVLCGSILLIVRLIDGNWPWK